MQRIQNIGKLAVAWVGGVGAVWVIVSLASIDKHYTGKLDVPKEDDTSFILASKSDLSHLDLWHGLGRSIDHAREADLLLVGNSRTQLGFRQESFLDPLEEMGILPYNLGVGHGELGRFFLELIRKHDLRPKLVIVNVDAGFFCGLSSDYGRSVMAQSRWEGWKTSFEGRACWEVARRVYSVVPSWQPIVPGGLVLYRSQRSGAWIPAIEKDSRVPYENKVKVVSNTPLRERDLSFAREFKAELDGIGGRMILTVVPSPYADYERAALFAKELNVPLIVYPAEGLTWSDGSHLSPDSAEVFARAFLSELQDLPEVRALRREP